MNYKKLAIAVPFCLFIYFIPGTIFSDNIEKANRYYEKSPQVLTLNANLQTLNLPGLFPGSIHAFSTT